jgi:hypothetical protein
LSLSSRYSFNGKLRDELLNGEIFYTMKEAQIVIKNWRRHYNTVRLWALASTANIAEHA